MDPKYSVRKSIPNSVAEKKVIESNAIEEKKGTKCEKFWTNCRTNWHKYVYTFCILYTYLFYGLSQNLTPTALNDLKFMLRSSMANINYVNTCGSIGYLTGALAGFSYKYINRQLFITANIIILSVCVAAIPMCQTIWQVYIGWFLASMGGGVWDAGNSVWVIELWGKSASVFLQLSQTCYGVGSIISPILLKPFLYGDLNKTESDDRFKSTASDSFTLATTLHTTSAAITSTEDINYSVDRRSKLRIPFGVGGGIGLIGAAILLFMFFAKRYKTPGEESQKTEKEYIVKVDEQTTGTPLEPSQRTRKVLILLLAMLLNSYSSLEVVYLNTVVTYLQYLPNVVISAPEAAQILMFLFITYTSGRFVSAFISTKLKAEVMLTYHIVIMGIALAILYIGQNASTVTLIYIGNCIYGFGYSAMWPAIFTFAETYVKLTDKITAIFSFASAFFSFITPFIIGPLLEDQPQVLIIIEIAYFCSVVVLFAIIMVIIKRSQRFPIMYTINKSVSI